MSRSAEMWQEAQEAYNDSGMDEAECYQAYVESMIDAADDKRKSLREESSINSIGDGNVSS